MKAIVVAQPGGPEVLQVTESPDPQAGPGEVLVDVAYSACNWADTEKRRGTLSGQEPDLPNRSRFRSLRLCVRSRTRCRRIPDRRQGGSIFRRRWLCTEMCRRRNEYVQADGGDRPATSARCFQVSCFTAYHLLFSAYHLQAGDSILVHAIGGALGLVITQMAKESGARVMGTVSSAAKGERAPRPGG